jgi:hypothetical protein
MMPGCKIHVMNINSTIDTRCETSGRDSLLHISFSNKVVRSERKRTSGAGVFHVIVRSNYLVLPTDQLSGCVCLWPHATVAGSIGTC